VYEYGSSLVDIARPCPGETILDIGCGTGELTNQLYTIATQKLTTAEQDLEPDGHSVQKENDKTTTVVGIDADENMINNAKQKFPSAQFLKLDIRSFLDEEIQPILQEHKIPQKYDLIFSNAVLHWIPADDIELVVKTISQLLSPDGGRLVVEFGGKGNVNTIVTACQDILREQYDIKDFVAPWYYPSIGEFTTILERHGIDVVSAELYDRPTTLNDPVNGMNDWIRMFGQTFIEAAISSYRINKESTSDDYDSVPRHDKESLFVAAVSERVRPKLHDGTKWIADYRRIRIVGYRKS
jgi:trans-aconitate methyltransferase